MRNYRLVLLIMGVIGTITAGANAQNTYKVDFLGDRALTPGNTAAQPATPGWHMGWNPSGIFPDHFTDDTSGTGAGGSLRLADSPEPHGDGDFKTNHLGYYMGEDPFGATPQFKAGATVVARIKNNGTPDPGAGIGYTTSDGNHTGILGIKDDGVSITGWNGNVFEYDTNGAAAGNSTAVPGGTVGQYRTYAFMTTHDGPTAGPGQAGTRYDVWVLNNPTMSWSNNPADWTQIITNFHRDNATGNMPDQSGLPNGQSSGILLGSFGPGFGGFSRTAEADLEFDWLNVEVNTPFNYGDNGPAFQDLIKPWALDYSGIPNVPEPGTLALLALASLGVMRRRRA